MHNRVFFCFFARNMHKRVRAGLLTKFSRKRKLFSVAPLPKRIGAFGIMPKEKWERKERKKERLLYN